MKNYGSYLKIAFEFGLVVATNDKHVLVHDRLVIGSSILVLGRKMAEDSGDVHLFSSSHSTLTIADFLHDGSKVWSGFDREGRGEGNVNFNPEKV